MKILKTFWNFLNPNSQINLDYKIEFYKKHVVYYKRFTAEFEDLESSIKKANGKNRKYLKIKLKNHLQEIYEELDYEAKKDIYDRAW